MALLVAINFVLLALALFLIQEGLAQQANDGNLFFFVKFPTELLPMAYLASFLLIVNFALTFLTLWHRVKIRRWPWATTSVAAALLLVICFTVGWPGVWTIINPNHPHKLQFYR